MNEKEKYEDINVLKVRHLSLQRGDFSLKDISFDVPKGYITGLVGKNGSGKTTLMKAVCNLHEKEQGSIWISEYDNCVQEVKAKNHIGIVIPECTFFEDKSLITNGELLGLLYENFSMERFIGYLVKFGLKKEKNSSSYLLSALSAGQRIRFQLAFALAHEPKLLLLDEPTANLDPAFRVEFLELLQEVIEEGKIGVLMSTHLTSDLDKIGDYIVLMNNGQVLACQTKEELLDAYPGQDVAKILLSMTRQEVSNVQKVQDVPKKKVGEKENEPCGKSPDAFPNPLSLLEDRIYRENRNNRNWYYVWMIMYIFVISLSWLVLAPLQKMMTFGTGYGMAMLYAFGSSMFYSSCHCVIGKDCLYGFAGYLPITRQQFCILHRERRRKLLKLFAGIQIILLLLMLSEMVTLHLKVSGIYIGMEILSIFLFPAAAIWGDVKFTKKRLKMWE